MLRKGRKWNHRKCSIETRKGGRERVEEKNRNNSNKQKTIISIVDPNLTVSMSMLNVNDLNAPITRQRLSEWIKKHDPTICCLTLNINTHIDQM